MDPLAIQPRITPRTRIFGLSPAIIRALGVIRGQQIWGLEIVANVNDLDRY